MLLVAFGDDVDWVQELHSSSERTLKELGALMLTAGGDSLVDTKRPATIASQQDSSLLQLSRDLRIAFTESAKNLDDDF